MPPFNHRDDPFLTFHEKEPQKDETFKKSVSFASHAQEYFAINRANYSPLEMKNSWYDKLDFVEFTLDIRRTVEIIERGDAHNSQLLDDVNYTTRGSICRKTCTARRRREIRNGAKECVLKAQDTFRHNAEYISSVYTQYSQASVQEALQQAEQDHHDAKMVVNSQLAAVAEFWDSYFSDAWITHFEDGSPPLPPPKSTQGPPNLLTDDFLETEPYGFDDSWLVGPVA
ncbi:unnamed protein product [Cylindrotheca closterium]|uniref:Uncharacterized protein n=1 Tax=Cylindrotheca closterium TaxID=2856 RepID=A0AAD2CFJ9_9STRA|nr:unnamed protein product [Cylindrotheca closterium]